jgi:hypothetical protein
MINSFRVGAGGRLDYSLDGIKGTSQDKYEKLAGETGPSSLFFKPNIALSKKSAVRLSPKLLYSNINSAAPPISSAARIFAKGGYRL